MQARIVWGLAAFPVALASLVSAAAQDGPAELAKFTSKAGKFSIKLPGKPEYEETTVGDAEEPQYQFKLGSEQGVYLVSYQENPNLKGATPEQLAAALESGRDRLLKVFRGKLLENEVVELAEEHPGLSFRITIPQASGEARCRFYLVGTRLYQVMAMGVPDFAGSDQATKVLDSFQLLK